MNTKAWLAPYTWEFVTAQNAVLCQAKSALHKPTSDGYKPAKALWERRHLELISLDEAVEICRQCHRLAPFCFYNGNTFTAIIRDVITNLGLKEDETILFEALRVTLLQAWPRLKRPRLSESFCPPRTLADLLSR